MMNLPPSFTKLVSAAKRCKAKDIDFSGGTYQIEIFDPDIEKEEWAFLQLDARGQLKDCFCSCENGDNESPCVHIVAGFLRIYQNPSSPLHESFSRSLWNTLGFLYAQSVGDDVRILQEISEGSYTHSSFGGKVVFEIEGLTESASNKIEELIHHRKRPTEETSLKFSNLSPQELALWREGRPSVELRYELSFWSDFAKWLMILQDEKNPYHISYEYDSEGLPCFIHVKFKDVRMGFYISRANLPIVVPSLDSVKSLLKVYGGTQQAFRKIAYDKKKGVLLVDALPEQMEPKSMEKTGLLIPGWRFVPGMGFYPADQTRLTEESILAAENVSRMLNEHFSLLKGCLEGASLHADPVLVSYALAFDKEWNLHITAYLFSPGDLTQGDSKYFGEWAYLDDDGFYHLQGMRFPSVDTVVKAEEVGSFVSQYRTWFNSQEGFQTHVIGIEAELSYDVSENNQLTFYRDSSEDKENEAVKDFSPWMYVFGQGFYSKANLQIGLPIKPGISLHADQIPLFIRANKEELKLVPKFFADTCPVIKSGLRIDVDSNDRIVVRPVDTMAEEFSNKKIRFFEDFVYLEGEGFSELPQDSKLSIKYRQEVLIEKEDEEAFILYELPSLKPSVSFLDPRLTAPSSLHLEVVGIEAQDRSYKVKLRLVSHEKSLPITSCWKEMKKRRRFLLSDVGLLDMHDKRWNWIHWLRKGQVDLRNQTIEFTNWELIRLKAFEDLLPGGPETEHVENVLKTLFEHKITEEPNLNGLNSRLRPYQEIGIRWLWFLYQQGLSGLLCDDMGLGKTHQTMALLAAIGNIFIGKAKPQFLVVCPTSVLYHWQEKLEAFLPGSKIFTYYGPTRNLESFDQEYDILLTSYGIWRQDVETLGELAFEAAVFDEIQIAKNHNSRIYASLQMVKARMLLGLTGTPIENHLRELKALFDLVLPGYMPGDTEYRELFVKPIEKEGDPKQRKFLSLLIKPFILRRKKENVLLDLPEKIEEISHCDLSQDQRQLYEDVLLRSREKIFSELEDERNPIPYIHIFALLSSLKQICNHPAVYLKTPDNYKDYTSGKWDLFVELLEEARESQQKVVVFSQYLYMLDIIESYLNEQGIGFASIRGSTQNRGEQLRRFNKDPSCEVFVASLQASGLGIDLTAASVVIHYDRWWTAARENQATDRVHRIGQVRGVQVFKLICKNTFEERIDELITQKGQLMENVVTIDEHEVIKQFSRDDIIKLLRLVN